LDASQLIARRDLEGQDAILRAIGSPRPVNRRLLTEFSRALTGGQ
jgi:hypothetical protein